LQDVQLSLQQLSQDHTPTDWAQLLQSLVTRFFKVTDDHSQRLLDRILMPLEQWLNDCQLAQFNAPLPLAVVRSHWLAHMDTGGLQRRFLGGGVQFATLMPMRSIPFKCVCLLGMNDGDYPRNQTPRDFDLMSDAAHAGSAQSHWRAGDRSRRCRQLVSYRPLRRRDVSRRPGGNADFATNLASVAGNEPADVWPIPAPRQGRRWRHGRGVACEDHWRGELSANPRDQEDLASRV
jgi:hypothetical protein